MNINAAPHCRGGSNGTREHFGQVLADHRGFDDWTSVVDERGNHPIWVDREVIRRWMLSGSRAIVPVHPIEFELGQADANDLAAGGTAVAVELQR